MKKFWIPTAIIFGLFLGSRPAAAAYVTGADLLKHCQSGKPAQIMGCMNYVAGIIDYQLMMQSLGTEPSIEFCLPADLSIEKASVVVMRYLEKSPQHQSFIAAPAVMMALQQSYPCRPVTVKNKKHGNK